MSFCGSGDSTENHVSAMQVLDYQATIQVQNNVLWIIIKNRKKCSSSLAIREMGLKQL